MMKKILEYKWQIVSLGILAFMIVSARGGAATLMPFLRFLVPIVLAVFLLGFLKKKVFGGRVAEAFKKQMEQAMQAQQAQQAAGGGRGGQKTIDLCPKCGSYDRPGHKCKSKK